MERSNCQSRVKRIIGIAGGSGPAMGSSEGSEFGVEWRFQLPFLAGMSHSAASRVQRKRLLG